MTTMEIIRQAIKQALANGWDNFGHYENWDFTEAYDIPHGIHFTIDSTALGLSFTDLIFDHDFARALWGEQGFPGEFTGKYPNPSRGKGGAQRGWEFHLQQMVIAADPIKYLGDNI